MTQGVHGGTTGARSTAAEDTVPEDRASGDPPVRRDPAVDAARVGCVIAVVFIHLLMVTLTADPRTGEPVSVLVPTQQPWYWWATWVLQIMPLFFVVGGAATAGAWRRRRERGVAPAEYVRERALRLVQPAALLWTVLALAVLGALAAGVSAQLVTFAVSGMGMPLWFLAAYLICQAVAPVFLALHERLGWVWCWFLLACVVVVDLVRIGTHEQWWGLLNMVFVWPLVQSFGFHRADGWFARRRTPALVLGAVVCYGLLGWCVASGAYSPDMLTNLNPPTVCMVLLGLAQACLLQVLTPALNRLMRRRPAQVVAFLVGTRGMSIYLWHLPVIVTIMAVWFFAGGYDPVPGSVAWWLLRVPLAVICWVAVILVASAVRFAETAPVTPWGQGPGGPWAFRRVRKRQLREQIAERLPLPAEPAPAEEAEIDDAVSAPSSRYTRVRALPSWLVLAGLVCAVVPPLVEIVTLLTPTLTIAGAVGSLVCVAVLRWGVVHPGEHPPTVP